MESLISSYASSDEEDEPQNMIQASTNPSPSLSTQSPKISTLFSSLPKPQSSGSSVFSSLPPPKSQKHKFSSLPKPSNEDNEDKRQSLSNSNSGSNTHTLLSSLPPPKSGPSSVSTTNSSVTNPPPKRVVQFKPPVPRASSVMEDEDEDDEEDERDRKRVRSISQDTSVKSFLSSIPAPKNSATLGALPTSGSGRRSIVETDAMTTNPDDTGANNHVVAEHVEALSAGVDGFDDSVSRVQMDQSYTGYASYSDYGNHGDYANYSSSGYSDSYWSSGSPATLVTETTGPAESVLRVSGKKGKDRMPTEIIEVKQDELMKNRPREDQAKLTGIAFGPSYQPASTKGKPSKLHKRKHQIGSLYFDMKQKEMELAERRAKGFLTKAETQAKYGW